MYSKNYATINLTKAGVLSNSQIGDIFPIGHEGMTRIRIDLVGTFHAVGTITFKLQTSPDLVNWVDSKTATTVVGTDATFRTITLMDTVAGDQTYLPLARNCRMVVSATNAGDTVSMTGIFVQQ